MSRGSVLSPHSREAICNFFFEDFLKMLLGLCFSISSELSFLLVFYIASYFFSALGIGFRNRILNLRWLPHSV